MNARAFLIARDGALRAPWRIVLFLVAAGAGTIVAYNSIVPLLGSIMRPSGLTVDATIWSLLLGLLAAHWIALRFLELPRGESRDMAPTLPARSSARGRGWWYVGLDRQAARPRPLVTGFALGALAIGAPTAALLGARWLAPVDGTPGSWGAAAVRLSFFLLPAALWEELFSRGYVFSVLRERWGWPATLVATSVVFGALHLQNQGADLRSAGLVTLAGIFLGMVLIATRSLYAAWMAHFAWNWTMAVVFHTAVSGYPMEAPDYRVVDNGPDWATGGSWGPEGGVPAGLGMAAGLVYLIARQRRREES